MTEQVQGLEEDMILTFDSNKPSFHMDLERENHQLKNRPKCIERCFSFFFFFSVSFPSPPFFCFGAYTHFLCPFFPSSPPPTAMICQQEKGARSVYMYVCIVCMYIYTHKSSIRRSIPPSKICIFLVSWLLPSCFHHSLSLRICVTGGIVPPPTTYTRTHHHHPHHLLSVSRYHSTRPIPFSSLPRRFPAFPLFPSSVSYIEPALDPGIYASPSCNFVFLIS